MRGDLHRRVIVAVAGCALLAASGRPSLGPTGRSPAPTSLRLPRRSGHIGRGQGCARRSRPTLWLYPLWRQPEMAPPRLEEPRDATFTSGFRRRIATRIEPRRGVLQAFRASPPDAGDYSCSGTAVRSPSRSLVWTAGHCVFDPGDMGAGYATDWEFVPVVRGGSRRTKPYGEWPASSLATTGSGMAAASSAGATRPSTSAPPLSLARAGRLFQDRIGARRIAFSQPRARCTAPSAIRPSARRRNSTGGTCSGAGRHIEAPTTASARRPDPDLLRHDRLAQAAAAGCSIVAIAATSPRSPATATPTSRTPLRALSGERSS